MSFTNRLLFLSLIIVFWSCNSRPSDQEFKLETFKAKRLPEVQAHIEFMDEEGPVAELINKTLTDSVISYISIQEKVNSIQEGLDRFAQSYQNFKKDFPDASGQWELTVDTEVIFQSETVISISANTYAYTGGAHGNDHISLLNFNPNTGKIYKLDDVISDRSQFTDIAETHFKSEHINRNKEFSLEDYFFGEAFQLPENIGFSEDGLILLYNVYEITSYAQGYTEFTIPYEELDDLLLINPY